MTPSRGLSMSEIRKNAMDTATGAIRNRGRFVRCATYPINKLQLMATAAISTHAAMGIRFHHAACVYPCEFNTSFIPETARATVGVICAPALGRAVDHNSFCNSAVSALTFVSMLRLRVV